RPVVSTRLAGIPELVLDRETGILVSPRDPSALTDALEQLLSNLELRLRYGRAGRTRLEQHFQIENTIAPLVRLFETTTHESQGSTSPTEATRATQATPHIAYLVDRWPDHELPLLERELEEMKRRDVSMIVLVCELNSSARLNRDMQQIAPSLQFLPDAFVLE